MERKADLVVVGGGPAGYGAALRAARLGAGVVLVTDEEPGGVCLRRGCIPSKALLEVARRVRELRGAGEAGLRVERWTVDLEGVHAFRDRAVRALTAGLQHLLRAAGVQVVLGRARLDGPGRVLVVPAGARPGGGGAGGGTVPAPAGPAGGEVWEAPRVLLATGSRPARLPWAEGDLFWDSDRALEVPLVPERLAVVGAGPVGMEMATVYHALGSHVTVVELLPRVLPAEDEDVSAEVARLYERRGVRVLTGVRVMRAEAASGAVRLHLELAASASRAGAENAVPAGEIAATGSGLVPATVEADAVLVAAGRRPRSEDLGLETVGLAAAAGGPGAGGGWIRVGPDLATGAPGVWAAGDVTGQRLLAHYALAQGVAAVEAAFGRPLSVNLDVVPACTFTLPEVASVGLTEVQAARRGEVLAARFPFRANGRAVTGGERDGFVKVVADAATRRVLGVHAVGPGAAEIVHEGALAVAAGLDLGRLASTIHAHPTYSEALLEATLLAVGLPRHLAT